MADQGRGGYPSDVTDEEWAFVLPYLLLCREDSPQRKYDLRTVFDAVRYVARTGGQWRFLPHDLPPWYVVYQQMQRWLRAGCFELLVEDVRSLLREWGGRKSHPSRRVNDGLGLDFDYEGLWQFGTFGPGNIQAWTVASETGYRFPSVRLKPRFSVKADISGGDNPTSKTLGTFNPLFPKGNYFGVLATTGPGPINFIEVHPHVETTFPHNVTASFDWIFQWREMSGTESTPFPDFFIRPAGHSHAQRDRGQR